MNVPKKVFLHTLRMIAKDRRYCISKNLKKYIFDPETFSRKHQNTFYAYYQRETADKHVREFKVLIHFSPIKFGVDKIDGLKNIVEKGKVKHIILITASNITQKARHGLCNLNNVYIEMFNFQFMIIDPINHSLVPKHKLLTRKEIKQLTKTFGKKIPGINITDPITRYYGAIKGEIFRIERKEEIYYRKVT